MSSSQKSNLARNNVRCALVGSLWLASVIIALALVTNHDFAAGAAGPSLTQWPTQSHVPFSDHNYSLVMFAHPRCPCTHTRLEELARLATRHPNIVTPRVVFIKPAGADTSWEQTDQWSTASTFPSMRVLRHLDGTGTRLFHAQTSHHTLLFGSSGELLLAPALRLPAAKLEAMPGKAASIPNTRETPAYGRPFISPTAGK
jgi:hypothetical protein